MPELIVTKDFDVPGIDALDVYRQHGGYEALAKALREYQPDDLVELIKQSGLRGRGGAGFPTGLKWSFLAKNDKPRYLCCNCDESEPGTFKDRWIMETCPHRLVEGVIITSYACRVTTAFIYVRGELAKAGRQVERCPERVHVTGGDPRVGPRHTVRHVVQHDGLAQEANAAHAGSQQRQAGRRGVHGDHEGGPGWSRYSRQRQGLDLDCESCTAGSARVPLMAGYSWRVLLLQRFQ